MKRVRETGSRGKTPQPALNKRLDRRTRAPKSARQLDSSTARQLDSSTARQRVQALVRKRPSCQLRTTPPNARNIRTKNDSIELSKQGAWFGCRGNGVEAEPVVMSLGALSASFFLQFPHFPTTAPEKPLSASVSHPLSISQNRVATAGPTLSSAHHLPPPFAPSDQPAAAPLSSLLRLFSPRHRKSTILPRTHVTSDACRQPIVRGAFLHRAGASPPLPTRMRHARASPRRLRPRISRATKRPR